MSVTVKQAAASVEPLGDQLLILQDAKEKETKGGILLPEKAQRRQMRGVVMKAGPGLRNDKGEFIPMTVKVGDTVMFPYSADDVKIQGHEFLFVRESMILGVDRNDE